MVRRHVGKSFPLGGRRKRIKVLVGMPVDPGEGGANYSAQVPQRFFIDLVSVQEI
jgi:hypothetical protein